MKFLPTTTILILLLLHHPQTTHAQIQTFTIHPTAQLLFPHPHRRLELFQTLPNNQNNSAVYASFEPFLSDLEEDARNAFLEEFHKTRYYSKHELAFRNKRRMRFLEGMNLRGSRSTRQRKAARDVEPKQLRPLGDEPVLPTRPIVDPSIDPDKYDFGKGGGHTQDINDIVYGILDQMRNDPDAAGNKPSSEEEDMADSKSEVEDEEDLEDVANSGGDGDDAGEERTGDDDASDPNNGDGGEPLPIVEDMVDPDQEEPTVDENDNEEEDWAFHPADSSVPPPIVGQDNSDAGPIPIVDETAGVPYGDEVEQDTTGEWGEKDPTSSLNDASDVFGEPQGGGDTEDTSDQDDMTDMADVSSEIGQDNEETEGWGLDEQTSNQDDTIGVIGETEQTGGDTENWGLDEQSSNQDDVTGMTDDVGEIGQDGEDTEDWGLDEQASSNQDDMTGMTDVSSEIGQDSGVTENWEMDEQSSNQDDVTGMTDVVGETGQNGEDTEDWGLDEQTTTQEDMTGVIGETGQDSGVTEGWGMDEQTSNQDDTIGVIGETGQSGVDTEAWGLEQSSDQDVIGVIDETEQTGETNEDWGLDQQSSNQDDVIGDNPANEINPEVESEDTSGIWGTNTNEETENAPIDNVTPFPSQSTISITNPISPSPVPTLATQQQQNDDDFDSDYQWTPQNENADAANDGSPSASPTFLLTESSAPSSSSFPTSSSEPTIAGQQQQEGDFESSNEWTPQDENADVANPPSSTPSLGSEPSEIQQPEQESTEEMEEQEEEQEEEMEEQEEEMEEQEEEERIKEIMEQEEEDSKNPDQWPSNDSTNNPTYDLPKPAPKITAKNLTTSGGLITNYQVAPLLQGYGTHYATVWVGTPPQRKSVIVDTGSHYTAFPCEGCNNCGEENHTDRYFDPGASVSFHALTCDECVASRCSGGRCTFSQSYTEGSSWQAYQVRDRFFVGSNLQSGRDDPFGNSFAIPFMFGCQTSETGLFVTQLADGIMGMSSHEATLPKQMYNLKKLEHNMFTLCFRRELTVSKDGITAGVITLGGIDTRLHSSPMVFSRNVVKSGWYTIFVRNIFLRKGGGQSAKADDLDQTIIRLPVDMNEMNSGKGVIVDSGTTDTYLHKSLASSFNEAWKSATNGMSFTNSAVRLTREQLMGLPTVLIQVSSFGKDESLGGDPRSVVGLAGDLDPRRPNDVILAFPATHYMEYSPSKDTYTSRLYFTESRGGVLGANVMQGHDVLFDWENGRVGFAESSCDYTEITKNLDQESQSQPTSETLDCQLSPPSLSNPCAQSIEEPEVMCQGQDPGYTLKGTERWVWLMENSGTPKGKTCEEMAIKLATDQNILLGDEVITVDCDTKGLCYLVKKCTVPCRDALNFVSEAESPHGSPCGDGTWGACTVSCTQSKITSVLMDDGNCHDVDTKAQTRDCHVGECARDDPCRVPFVVHIVIGLGGVDPTLWNKKAEDMFANSLALVAGSRDIFGPGDINVLMANQWSDEQQQQQQQQNANDQEETKPSGIKLIVEISIYNPTAHLPEDDTEEPADEYDSTNSTATGLAAILEKINFLKSKPPPKSTCKEEELYPYAKNALYVHTQLQDEAFLPRLIQALNTNSNSDELSTSAFREVGSPDNLHRSKVLTSWTIKTEVGGGAMHDHADDESLIGQPLNWNNVKKYVRDLPLMATALGGLLLLVLLGAYCGYKCERRRDLRRAADGDRIHSGSLMAKMRSRTADAARGKYRPLSTDTETDAAELELT